MGQRSVRFPDELVARAEVWCEANDRPFSYVAVKALEAFLDGARVVPSRAEVLAEIEAVHAGQPRPEQKAAVRKALVAEVEGGNVQEDAVQERGRVRQSTAKSAAEIPKIAPRHWA